MSRLDIILFGATGCTGRNCIKYLHQLTKLNTRPLTWGIAGRFENKLHQVLRECSKSIGEDLKDVPIFVADVGNDESLRNMTSSAKLIINCCGPYQVYGEPVVVACLETCTHHVDVSGEPYYMENMFYKYDGLAKEKGVYIISACGFDSVPIDLGIVFLQQQFQGTVNTVEAYVRTYYKNFETKNTVNVSTWKSALNGGENYQKLRSIRKKIFNKRLPNLSPELPIRPSLFKNDVTNTWTRRYAGADRSVAYRTQRHFYEHQNARPVQINVFDVINSFVWFQFSKLFSRISNSLLEYKFGEKIIFKQKTNQIVQYPKLLSGGRFCDVTDDYSNDCGFQILMDAKGWDQNLDSTSAKFDRVPNKRLIFEFSGSNPGYGFTCVSVILCAVVLLTEKETLPKNGGVYTPGVAFAKTTLMSQLLQNGLKLKIKSSL